MTNLWSALAQHGLVKGEPRDENALSALCEAGALDGGLSVALDAKPDEVFGPLCAAVGPPALRLKVLDARDAELLIRLGDEEASWEVPDVPALVERLNDQFRKERAARAVAVLGEWEDALQLWAVPKAKLPWLLKQPFFQPQNALEP